jgi:hypothetical protein
MKVILPDSAFKITIDPTDDPQRIEVTITATEPLTEWLNYHSITDSELVITEEPLQFFIAFQHEAEAVMFRLAWSE